MDIEFNKKCYHFEKIKNKDGILEKSVDATYIIHLKDNGRLEHIYSQLENFAPTKTIYIVFNNGFKNCNKKLIEQVSYQDLTDAFLQCFDHANKNNYNNILILEDDFIFNPEIKRSENVECINNFINKQMGKEFIYYLGCNPIIIFPCTNDFKHYKSYKSLSMHAIIYSKQARFKTLDLNLKHWDVIVEQGIKTKYLFHKPLCYQTYPDTENKLTWGEKDSFIIASLKNLFIKILNLDKQVEPGFTILYLLAKFGPFFLIIVFIIFILCFFKLFLFFFQGKKPRIKK